MRNFYLKHKEILRYLFFGVCTTLVNWLVHFLFVLLVPAAKEDKVLSTLTSAVAWFCAAVFAFFTYKKWVFENDEKGGKTVLVQFVTFLGSRAITLGTDALLAYFCTEPLKSWAFLKTLPLVGDKDWLPVLVLKIMQAAVNMVVNYLFSKYVVFRKKKKPEEHAEEESQTDVSL